MKSTIYCLFGIFSITTAGATVYDGTYTTDIKTTNNSLVEKGATFDNAKLYVGQGVTLTILDDVKFINEKAGIDFWGNFGVNGTINLNGDNISFSKNNHAIVAGYKKWNNTSSAIVKDINVKINGNNTIFDENRSSSGTYDDGNGGAIYIGNPNSWYYYSGYRKNYRQSLTINGAGTIFSNNTAAGYGGAIYGYEAIVSLNSPVVFDTNHASRGGAIYNGRSEDVVHGQVVIAPASQFLNNSASSGGAIYNSNSYVRIGAETIFRDNTATNGGAIYNAGANALVDIDTGVTAVHFETASDSIYNSGGTINFLGTGQIDGGLTQLTSVRGDKTTNRPVINLGKASAVFDTVSLQDNTTLKTTVWADGMTIKAGNLSANTFNIQNNDELKLQIAVENRNILSPDGSVVTILTDLSGSQDAGWDYFGNTDKYPQFVAANNLLYDIEFVSDGVYKITPKAGSTFDPTAESDVLPGIADAWDLAGFDPNSTANQIANQLYVLRQFEDTLPEYNATLDMIMPEHANVINDIIGNNTNGNFRFLSRRMTGGKTGFWATGGYKMLDNGDTYTGHAFGGTIGQDIEFKNGLFTLGQAFGYSRTSIDSDVRKYDINNSFDLSIYGNLNLPIESNDLYFSAIVSHGAYDITENKTALGYGIDAEFDATQTSGQANIGVRHGIFGGDIGYRYTYISQGAYTDTIGQRVSSMNTDASHALANLYIADNDGGFQWGAYIGGEFSLGKSEYDNIATAPNGQRYTYTIKSDNSTAFVFGAHIDIALNTQTTIGLAYDGLSTGTYSEHTGKLRFNWAW